MGGQITDGRVWGGLIPSRTLGDFPWKDKGPGLIATPEEVELEVTSVEPPDPNPNPNPNPNPIPNPDPTLTLTLPSYPAHSTTAPSHDPPSVKTKAWLSLAPTSSRSKARTT